MPLNLQHDEGNITASSVQRSEKDNMPRYFIDTQDGEHYTRDEDGIVLPGLHAACNEAVRVLPDIAHDLLSNVNLPLRPGQLDFIATVKDEHSQPLFRATFSLSTEWLAPHPTWLRCRSPCCSGRGEDSMRDAVGSLPGGKEELG